jgi:hypothetical protein
MLTKTAVTIFILNPLTPLLLILLLLLLLPLLLLPHH